MFLFNRLTTRITNAYNNFRLSISVSESVGTVFLLR